MRLIEDLKALQTELKDDSPRTTRSIARRIQCITTELPLHFEEEEEVLPLPEIFGCPDHEALIEQLVILRGLAKSPTENSRELRASTDHFLELIERHLAYEEPLLAQAIVEC